MARSWVKHLQDQVVGNQVKPPADFQEQADWSGSLLRGSSSGGFSEGLLASLALPGEVSAMAFEPITGYLAVATTEGTIHLFGAPAVQISWNLRPAVKVKDMLFKSGTGLLIVVGESKSQLHQKHCSSHS